MDITKLNVTELKALAYDQLVQIENAQNNLKILNAEIVTRQQEEAKAAEVSPDAPQTANSDSDKNPPTQE